MKLVVSHSKKVRLIEGPYNICGSGKDLLLLAREIIRATKEDPCFYGWVEISEKSSVMPNTIPDAWDE